MGSFQHTFTDTLETIEQKKELAYSAFLNDFQAKCLVIQKIRQIELLSDCRIVYAYPGRVLKELVPSRGTGNECTVVIRPDLMRNKHDDGSTLLSEVTDLSFSCGALMITVTVAVGSALGAPMTFGATTFLTPFATAGAVATGLQCINAFYRVKNVLEDNEEENKWLDSQEWYTTTSSVVDVASVLGAAGAVAGTYKSLGLLKATVNPSRSRVDALKVLKTASRPQRKEITRAIIASNHKGNVSKKTINEFMRANKIPKRYTRFEITKGINTQLADATAGMLSLAGSAKNGVLNQSAGYLINVIQSVETY